MRFSLPVACLTLLLGIPAMAQDGPPTMPAGNAQQKPETKTEVKKDLRKPITLRGGPGYTIRYLADVRVAGGWNTEDHGLDLMAAEADVTGASGEHWDWAVQVPFYTEMEGRGRDMHFGNAYAIYRGKLGEPTLKLGQYVVPFATLAVYETHSQVVQTLYAYSLGVRIDPGLEIEGYLNPNYPYQLSITTGSGSYRGVQDGSHLLIGRISHTFQLGDNELRLGLSAAQGKLPVFSTMGDPLMGRAQMLGYRWKTLAAIDGEYYLGPYLFRAEWIGGRMGGATAYGHWLQFSYPLNYKTSVEIGAQRWSQFSGGLTGFWAGVEHKLAEARTLRLVAQHMRMREGATGGMGPGRMDETTFTAQLYLKY